MAYFRPILIFILIPLLSGISCSPRLTTTSPTTTQTGIPFPSPTPTEIPTIEPTVPASPVPSDIPTFAPIITSLYLPNGIVTFLAGSGKVTYYDLQGQLLGDLQAQNLATGSYQQADNAGPLTYLPGPLLPPLVYYVFENGGELRINTNNNISLLKTAPNLLNIIGVPGKSFMAYTLLEYMDVGLRSLLYLGDIKTITAADPILDNTNTESYAIKSMAISILDDYPSGVWYTTVPYGIGGDIVFEPSKTLNYLDLSDYQIKTYLDMTKSPVGISPDQTWVGYTPSGGNGPMSIVHNFDFSTATTFPLRPDSDRGSGEAVFSPDNYYIAWREASGTITAQPPTFREIIRIANVDGNILTEVSDSSMVSVSGFEEIGWVIPVGWLDTQTLALEIRGSGWNNACIVSIKFDGSGLTYIAPGSFVGFLYP